MKHRKIHLLDLFYLLYFSVVIVVVTSYLIHTLRNSKSTEQLDSSNVTTHDTYESKIAIVADYENYCRTSVLSDADITITTNTVVIPAKENMLELKEDYTEISSRFAEIEDLRSTIIFLFEEVSNSPVCSIANRNFNLLSETYDTYKEKISEIQEYISLYEEKYQDYLDRILNIPKFLPIYQEKYDEFKKLFLADYETVCAKKQDYNNDDELLYTFYIDAKQIADDLFEEYYDLMCHIVYAEAGNCSEMEQCFVANVAENRVKDPNCPNTLYGVIYEPGQYEPVMNGSINKTPSKETKQIVENYLRGNVETGMPDNVLFQALFTQGKGVWNSGIKTKNIFCYG